MNVYTQKYNQIIYRSVFIIAMIVFTFFASPAKAYTPQFSQFFAAPLYLAPSFAGATDGSRVILNYRNQWPSLPGTFVTYSFAFDHYFHDYNSGIGLMLFRDQAGSSNLSTTNAGLLYSYNFNIDRNWTIRPGLHFIYSQRNIDYSQFLFADQINLDGNDAGSTITSFEMERVSYFDASFSVLAHTQSTWFGASVDHLMTPDQSVTNTTSSMPLKISAFGGYRFQLQGGLGGISDEFVTLNALFKNQGSFNQLDVGGYWSKEPLSFGLLYRGVLVFNNPIYGNYNNDALVLMTAFRRENIRVGYSYDFTISNLGGATGGSHELSIIYHFNQQEGGTRCPLGDCPYSPYQ